MSDIEKLSILLIDGNSENRSYFSMFFSNLINKYNFITAENIQETQMVINASKLDEIHFVILNSQSNESILCTALTILKNHPSSLLATIIVISDNLDKETEFLLGEFSVAKIFAQDFDAQDVINLIEKGFEEKNKNLLFKDELGKFCQAVLAKDISTCSTLLESKNFSKIVMNSIETIHYYGEYLILIGKYDQCIEEMELSLATINEGDINNFQISNILNCKAKALCLCNQYDDALKIYQEMSEKSPKNLNHKINLGSVHVAKGNWKSTIEIIDNVLKIDPKNKNANLLNAQAYAGLGEIENANLFLEKVAGTIEFHSIASFFNNRGVAFAQKKDFKKALEFYNNALFFTKNDIHKIQFNISLALKKQGKLKEAGKILNKIKNTKFYKEKIKSSKIEVDSFENL
ncbi:hypothetical protein QEJ31_07635 [Pigmentibacter sp. JX0631]|uniref:CDC27 family protein n=1 Tax=Pigmentibacter sp. JX0631 TaxID=2976982 RepID=UPI0024696EBB|nr:CDC27 family protein [Pigmentibacter sp. JX0631]WGL61459.1 hypothetical protein QEJ31_07635 [Pigmentibacter sp. JX0631]